MIRDPNQKGILGEEALRGHTPDIRTGKAEDDEMVQTATSGMMASES